jgi:hypothetical protein
VERAGVSLAQKIEGGGNPSLFFVAVRMESDDVPGAIQGAAEVFLRSPVGDSKGITGAEFCPLRSHLMLVRYDRDIASSQSVLVSVNTQNYNARLIGPI